MHDKNQPGLSWLVFFMADGYFIIGAPHRTLALAGRLMSLSVHHFMTFIMRLLSHETEIIP
jgi:hypothetical protein